MGAFFPIFVNIVDGIKSIDGRFFELASVYEVSKREFITGIIIPGALPSIMTGIRVGLGNSGKQGRYGILYPELDGNTLREAVEKLPTRDNSPFDISSEDARIIVEEIAPYWKGKTFHEDLAKALTAETAKLTYNPDW